MRETLAATNPCTEQPLPPYGASGQQATVQARDQVRPQEQCLTQACNPLNQARTREQFSLP